jgi:hypothetical protein
VPRASLRLQDHCRLRWSLTNLPVPLDTPNAARPNDGGEVAFAPRLLEDREPSLGIVEREALERARESLRWDAGLRRGYRGVGPTSSAPPRESLADRLTSGRKLARAPEAPLGWAIGMNRSTFDAVAAFEQRLSDVLRDVQRARLEFEARLSAAVAAEQRIEREHDEEHVDKLAGEIVGRSPLRGPLPRIPQRTASRVWWPFRRTG